MKKLYRTEAQFNDDKTAAGLTFIGTRMEDMLRNAAKLDDTTFVTNLAEDYFKNQIETKDTQVSSTQTKVYAAIRIIKSAKVVDALNAVINSKHQSVSPAAKEAAQKCLQDIYDGKLRLPYLE